MRQETKKLAVVFPGIGYTKDKPLLYYASKLVKSRGYEVIYIEYHNLPAKIQGNPEMMKKAAELAFAQTEEQLKDVAFTEYEDVIFIGKSIGTVIQAKYAAEQGIKAGQIWYTPVEATFSFNSQDVLAFIGDADPWSDYETVKRLAEAQGVKLYTFEGCNHSLETDDVLENVARVETVMQMTANYGGLACVKG